MPQYRENFFSRLLQFSQKDLASKILVTDKAVSKWERGLGFPDINTIEPLADALDVSIGEIMKSERSVDENVEEKEIVEDIIQIATVDIEERNKIIVYTFALTTLVLTILKIVMSISWSTGKMSLHVDIPLLLSRHLQGL